MTTRLVIIGCGGFGREVHDVVDAINDVRPTWELVGYLDDNPDLANLRLVQARGFQVLGGIDWLLGADSAPQFVIGIGTGKVRRAIDQKLTAAGVESATLVHPAATLGYDARVGAGTVICAGVRATNNISLGRHVHLNLNATVGHDSTLSDYVTVNPLVAISGGVQIGSESMVGTHAAILQQLTIGEGSTVGAGACVVKDVPSGSIVKGVPAK